MLLFTNRKSFKVEVVNIYILNFSFRSQDIELIVPPLPNYKKNLTQGYTQVVLFPKRGLQLTLF